MNKEELLSRYLKLQSWQSNGQRAPHKPLLLLWSLGRCIRGEPRLVSFREVDQVLSKLLKQYSPLKQHIHTEQPFWRLQKDQVWEVNHPEIVTIDTKGNPSIRDLRENQISGGLLVPDYEFLNKNPDVALAIASSIVSSHFPDTLVDEVLSTTLGEVPDLVESDLEIKDEWVTFRQRRRDSRFRKLILPAYGVRCAVCEYSGAMDGKPIAIEAAHIKWHQAKGPAVIENGIALCSLHHRLFDKGAFTLQPDLKIVVSEKVSGTGVEKALGQFDGEVLPAPPLSMSHRPNTEYIRWHNNQVFLGDSL